MGPNTAGRGAEEQATRRARRLARLQADAERGAAVDQAAIERLRRNQQAWAAGAEGERRVADSLASLERFGWAMLHDVRWPDRARANVDHIAIGPGGVFVIDAKNWSGDVRVTPTAVRQNGYGRAPALEGVKQAAAAVTAILEPQHRSAVRGVMCLAGQQDQPVTTVDGVLVCGRWELPQHLLDVPPRLSVLEIADITRYLARELDPDARLTRGGARRTPTRATADLTTTGRSTAARRPAGLAGYLLLAGAALLGAPAQGIAGMLALASVVLFLGSLWTLLSGRRFTFLRSRAHGALGIVLAFVVMMVAGALMAPPGSADQTSTRPSSTFTDSTPSGIPSPAAG